MAGSSKIHPLKRFINLLTPEKDLVISIYIYAIFAGLLSLTLPLGIQAIINLIQGGTVSSSWILLVILVILGVIATGFLQIKQITLNEIIQQKIFTRASFEFAYRIPRFKMDQVKNTYLPELINRFFDTMSIQKGLSKILIDFSTASFQIIFGLILLSFYHPFFILFSFLLVALVLLIVRFTGPKGLKTSIEESSHKYETAHWLEELARNVTTFKMSGNSDLPLNRNDDYTSKYLNSRKSHFKVIINQFTMMVAFKALVAAGLLLIGGILVFEQQMNIGQFVAAEIVIILIINSVEKLLFTIEAIYDVLTAVEKVGHVTDVPLEEYMHGHKSIEPNEGLEIKIRSLNYTIDEQEEIYVKDINLDIPAGQKVCLTGTSNAGKSILLQLLSAWYDTYTGTILYNNTSLRDINLHDLRYYIGDCLSTEGIFQGTVEENLIIGNYSATKEDIIEASKITGLYDYVINLTDGFNKQLFPGDRTIPKRVKQKILWTRGILGDKKLIFWEDVYDMISNNEKHSFIEYLTDKDNPRTVFLISNDMEIMKKCDRILGLQKGEVIHDVAPDELNDIEFFKNICTNNNA